MSMLTITTMLTEMATTITRNPKPLPILCVLNTDRSIGWVLAERGCRFGAGCLNLYKQSNERTYLSSRVATNTTYGGRASLICYSATFALQYTKLALGQVDVMQFITKEKSLANGGVESS